MRFTYLTLLVSVISPLAIYASHIPVRRQGLPAPPAPSPPVSPPGRPSAPSPASGAPIPPVPAPPGPGALPIGAVSGVAKGLPVNTLPPPPPVHPRRAQVDKYRRQLHNADFASSGSLPSSNIESVAASDDEAHEPRSTRSL